MEFEVLKKSHLKRNIIIGIVIVAIISAVILNFTKAKYRTTQSIPLVNGTINYSLADLNIIGLYINGEEATVKQVVKTREGIELHSMNPYYPTKKFTFEDMKTIPVKIIGRVREAKIKGAFE